MPHPQKPVKRVAIVTRAQIQTPDGKTEYLIRGEYASAEDSDDVRIVAGPVTGTWWDVPLPPCPDCGGNLVWYEAGWVPGIRRCMGQPIDRDPDGNLIYDTEGGCGSMFSVDTEPV